MRQTLFAATMLLPIAASASTLETFDVPRATATCGTAISSDGFIGGFTTKPRVSGPFGYRNGNFFFPRPYVPAGTVVFNGVNRSRTFVGSVIESGNYTQKSFVYGGRTTHFPAMLDGTVISLNAINDAGGVMGQVAMAKPSKFAYETLGFLQNAAGQVTLINDGSGDTRPAGMDTSASYVVGRSGGGAGTVGWVLHRGSFSPVAFPGALYTSPTGVDGAGRVTGTYYAGSPAAPVPHGFSLAGGVYASWDVPGAAGTQIRAMNGSGQITGCYTGAGLSHGFVFTP